MPEPANHKELAQSADPAVRARVAADVAAPPELLYYLSSDKADEVRAAAAGNEATPIQAAPALVMDESRYVRAALARKIGRVLSRMGEGASSQIILSTLEKLCSDTAVEVRQAVAVTLQDTAFLPPALARQLAEDGERAVAGPVLRFCLSLSDDDLVALVRNAKREWVPVEVAGRANLSNEVAAAVWESGNAEAAAILLGNTTASTTPALLDEATDTAAVEVELQAPLVRHPRLNHDQIERLASFVDGELLGVLNQRVMSRGELSDVSGTIRRRLDWAEWRKKGGTGSVRAQALFDRKQLDDAAVSDAIAWGERDFIVTALALLARTPEAVVQKVLEHQSPKGITALCWHAGLAMRTCRLVQIRTARVPAAKALNAREGFHYPLPEADMKWQLEFYGIISPV